MIRRPPNGKRPVGAGYTPPPGKTPGHLPMSGSPSSEESSPANAPLRATVRGPLGALLDLFTSVRFGIVLLVLLFIYMSVGSAGILYPVHPNIFHPAAWRHEQMRQWRPFEMTEFEWFHWWPFDLLLVLLAANIVIVTVRRIPRNAVHAGAWIVHAGLLLMMIGGWIYFGTKVEGDVPVVRRRIVATLAGAGPDGPRVEMVASPGQVATLDAGDRRYLLEVTDIDPEWEMRSGDSEGTSAYSVNVSVRQESQEGSKTFLRQLLAGHPEHTEDVILTGDESQPMKRAIKETGKPLVDETLSLSLEYDPARWFFLKNDFEKAFALYVRRPGDAAWVERPIEGLPLYNDYVASREEVLENPGEEPLPIDPIDVAVPAASADDPAPGTTLRLTGYLRYALERTQYLSGPPGAPFAPVAWLTLAADDGSKSEYRLEALDPRKNKGDRGLVQFRAIRGEEELAALRNPPTLVIRIPEAGVEIREPVREIALGRNDAEFVKIGETGYSYRVIAVQDDIILSRGSASVAIVELETPKGAFRRWVFADPALTRDVTEESLARLRTGEPDPHGGAAVVDPSIDVRYEPGHGIALLTLVVGPEPDRLRLVNAIGETEVTVIDVAKGRGTTLPAGLVLRVDDYLPSAVEVTKPFVIPKRQRDRDAGLQFVMAKLESPGPAGTESRWIPYHVYPFEGEREVLRRYPYRPDRIRLADGSELEVMLSRQRLPLPSEVALEEFILTAHVGGFTGETSTIRDYTSMLRFRDAADGTWSEPVPTSVNKPAAHDGLSFFQAQWDPPDPARDNAPRASRGLNYTVLGVANRNGVWTMLLGTIVSCLGMMYAFYVKPAIRRKRLEEALAANPAARARIEAVRARQASEGGVA